MNPASTRFRESRNLSLKFYELTLRKVTCAASESGEDLEDWRRSCYIYVDLAASQIDGDDDADGRDDPIVFHVVRENAVIGAERIYYADAALPPSLLSLGPARADDLRRHVLRNRPRSVKKCQKSCAKTSHLLEMRNGPPTEPKLNVPSDRQSLTYLRRDGRRGRGAGSSSG